MADDTNNGMMEESFEEMLQSYEDGMDADIKVGDLVRGKIIAIDTSTVFVDTGTKIDGVAERAELLDESGELPFAEGDEIELYVVNRTGSEIRLSRALSGIGGLRMLEQAFENKLPIEGTVTGTCKGGFHVEIMKRRAFCPISQIDLAYVEDGEAYVGQTHEFLITKLEERGRNVVVSRRELMMREQAASEARFLDEIKPGTVLEGRVTRLAGFGAFVQLLPGLDGLVHISELGWSRVDDPADVVAPGDPVAVKFLGAEHDAKGRLKISLSMKQAMDDPWNTVSERFKPGDLVDGTVTRLAKFGAFVEIAPGIEGLVHISQMSYVTRVNKPEEIVQPGQAIKVAITDVDIDARRIGLSLKEAEGDPWSQVEERFSVGGSYEGTVEKMERFGLFVNLMPGVTGLMPKSHIQRSENAKAIEAMGPGEKLAFKIESIDAGQRRMTLVPTDAAQAGDWKQFSDSGAAPAASGGMGLLGEKLAQAMKNKK